MKWMNVDGVRVEGMEELVMDNLLVEYVEGEDTQPVVGFYRAGGTKLLKGALSHLVVVVVVVVVLWW